MGGRWARAARRRWPWLAFIALAGLVRFVVALPGWYVHDDFRLKYLAANASVGDYVLDPYAGHPFPIALLLDRLRVELWPSYGSAALLATTALVLAGVIFLRLLELLRIDGAARWLALGFFMLSPLTSETTLWWAAALNGTLMLPFLVLALLGTTRYVLGAGRRYLVLVVVAQLVSFGVYVKTVAFTPWLLLFGLVLLPRDRWRRLVAPVASSAVLTLGYLGSVLLLPDRASSVNDINVGGWAQLLGAQIRGVLLPAAGGGPWSWFNVYGDPVSSFDVTVTGMAVGATAWVLVVVGLRAGRRLRTLLLPLGWAAVGAAVHVLGRGDPDWVVAAGHTLRYAADLVVPLSVMIGVAAIPLVRVAPTPSVFGADDRRTVAGVLAGALVVSMLVAWLPVSIAWRSGPGREWAQRALDSAREASASLGPLLYEGAPGNVAAPVWGEAGSVRGALAGETTVPWTSSRALGWDGPVPMVVTEGEAGPGVIDPMHRVPGSGECVVMVDEGQTVEAPLDSPAEIRTWLVRLRARAVSGSDGTVTLAFPGGESVLAQLPPGGGYAYLALEGQGDRVEVRTTRGGLCIQELLIGRGQLTG